MSVDLNKIARKVKEGRSKDVVVKKDATLKFTNGNQKPGETKIPQDTFHF